MNEQQTLNSSTDGMQADLPEWLDQVAGEAAPASQKFSAFGVTAVLPDVILSHVPSNRE